MNQAAMSSQLLQAMGIEPLRVRFALPLAKAEEIVADPVLIEQTPVVSDKTPEFFSIIGAPVQAANEVSIVAQQALRFRQRLVRMDQLLFFIEQPALQWAEEKPALAFLQDIYFALFGRKAQSVQQAGFQWPPAKDLPLDNTWQSAQQTFSAFVQSMVLDNQPTRWVSFGSAVDFLVEKPLQNGEKGIVEQTVILKLDCLPFYWRSAENKKQLWQQLQTIR